MSEIPLGTNPPFDPHSQDWVLVKSDPVTGMATYEAEIVGYGTVIRHEYVASQALWNANQTIRNETDGQRWGDGQIVASIPMNELYSPNTYLGQAFQDGDTDSMKKFLDDSDNIKYRTKTGRLT